MHTWIKMLLHNSPVTFGNNFASIMAAYFLSWIFSLQTQAEKTQMTRVWHHQGYFLRLYKAPLERQKILYDCFDRLSVSPQQVNWTSCVRLSNYYQTTKILNYVWKGPLFTIHHCEYNLIKAKIQHITKISPPGHITSSSNVCKKYY